MTAAGKVIVGFSAPYVGLYKGANTYVSGRRLARGVGVSLSVEASDGNVFYADNVAAESDEGKFQKGSVKLTVDGLHDDAERLVYGLPEPEKVTYGENKTVEVTNYGDNAEAPYVGVGYVIKYKSKGVETYQPMILPKTKFITHGTDAQTQEEQSNYQTQDLEATIHRDDSENHNWKRLFAEQATEAEAVAILEAMLGVGKENA